MNTSVVTQTCETGAVDPATKPLTLEDRCDRCGAEAYVRYSKDGTALLFCVHHNTQHKAKMSEWADVVHDESARLYKVEQATS